MFKRSPKPPQEGPSFSDDDMARARKWFAQGQSLAEKKNYDYAIESYINGLGFWPEAVEEGHKPCRAAALFRGGQKIGFGDSMKYKTNVKDPRQAMLNAEMLLSKDPRNVGYMEAMFRNAAKGRYDATTMWIGEIFADAAAREEKPSPARFELLRQVYEELGDRAMQTDPRLAITALDRAVDAMSKLQALKPTDMGVSTDLRDLAGKLTILKGRYASAESFKDSIQDSEGQRALHDEERVVQSDTRMDELLTRSKSQYEAAPTNAAAINQYVDLLCRREVEADETRAIGILVQAFKDTREYRYKLRADDIRIKQLTRKAREIAASGDRDAARTHLKEQLRFELGVFKERVRQYPTDLRLRYEYGRRLFQAGQYNPAAYDEAIPILQEARADPKTRTHCSLYIGRCFFEKGYFSQAIDTIREAIESYEIPDDDIGKEMHYWLGRALQSDGRTEDALKTYGQLIQWDYNYRKGEVRKRIDDLKGGGAAPAGK